MVAVRIRDGPKSCQCSRPTCGHPTFAANADFNLRKAVSRAGTGSQTDDRVDESIERCINARWSRQQRLCATCQLAVWTLCTTTPRRSGGAANKGIARYGGTSCWRRRQIPTICCGRARCCDDHWFSMALLGGAGSVSTAVKRQIYSCTLNCHKVLREYYRIVPYIALAL